MAVVRCNIRVLSAAFAVAISGCLLLAAPASAKPKPITDAQAISYLNGKGGLPSFDGGKAKPLPANERPYALRMYRSGPYHKPVLNLFYAGVAATIHYMKKKDREDMGAALLLLGRDGLADQFAQSVHHPESVTRFGVTVRQFANAAARGAVAGLLG